MTMFLDMQIQNTIDQIVTIQTVYYFPQYILEVNDKGQITDVKYVGNKWSSDLARQSFDLLTERLNLLIARREELYKKKDIQQEIHKRS